jgi:transcription antitermination factor NusG
MAKRKFWYVASTHYQQEGTAKRELSQQGYEADYPMMRFPRNREGIRRVGPLFEGYVFIRACPQWRSVNGTRGVQKLLLNGDTPSRILDEDLQFFLTGSVDDKGYYANPSVRIFRAGDSVSPRSGRFAGLTGEFMKMTKDAKAEILYWMFGRAITAQIPLTDLG